MKIRLEKLTGVVVGGEVLAIDTDKDMEYEETLQLLDDDGNKIVDAEEPVLSFIGKDGHRYVVSLNSVTAFQLKP